MVVCRDCLDDLPTCEDYKGQWENELRNQAFCKGYCVNVNGAWVCNAPETELVLIGEREVSQMVQSDSGFGDKEIAEVVCVRKYTCVCSASDETGSNFIYNVVDATHWEPWRTITEVIGKGPEDCTSSPPGGGGNPPGGGGPLSTVGGG